MQPGVQQSDSCRLAQLRSHTAQKGHLYQKFSWGNRKSLVEQPSAAGIDVRKRLFSYYKSVLSLETAFMRPDPFAKPSIPYVLG